MHIIALINIIINHILIKKSFYLIHEVHKVHTPKYPSFRLSTSKFLYKIFQIPPYKRDANTYMLLNKAIFNLTLFIPQCVPLNIL